MSLLLALALAAQADPHAGHAMPAQPDPHAGHKMPAQPDPHAGHTMPAQPDPHAGHKMPAQPDPHAGHKMPAQADPHAGHKMPAQADPHAGHVMPPAAPAIPGAPAPAAPGEAYADRFFDPAEMARARAALRQEHGGMRIATVTFNLAEYQARKGDDGYRWDGEFWYGGDINRIVVRTEGEGGFKEGVEEAEVQALYSRALDAYWNLQAGIRADFEPNGRAYAVLGVEGLAPYWFDVESAVFLSDRGDLLGRVQATYDQRITNRLIAQPFVEANVALQDVPRDRIGSGLSDLELGLRVRYEIAREFAPYVGISWERAFGDTARFARADGDDPNVTAFVIGLRTWF